MPGSNQASPANRGATPVVSLGIVDDGAGGPMLGPPSRTPTARQGQHQRAAE